MCIQVNVGESGGPDSDIPAPIEGICEHGCSAACQRHNPEETVSKQRIVLA